MLSFHSNSKERQYQRILKLPHIVRPAPADAVAGVPAGRRGRNVALPSPCEGAHQDQRPSAREGAHQDQRPSPRERAPRDQRLSARERAHRDQRCRWYTRPSLEGKMLSTSALSLAKDAFFASPQSCQTQKPACIFIWTQNVLLSRDTVGHQASHNQSSEFHRQVSAISVPCLQPIAGRLPDPANRTRHVHFRLVFSSRLP